MATPSDRLARAHASQQARGGLAASMRARQVFEEVNLANPAEVELAIQELTPLLITRRDASRIQARNYYRQAQLLAGLSLEVLEELPETDDRIEARIRGSLWGIANKNPQQRAANPMRWSTTTRREISRASVRHVLNGGRESIVRDVKRDRTAIGFVRVTARDLRVCAFCMMLASREDYKGTSFARSDIRFKIGENPLANAKVHDGCRCSLQPIFQGQDTPEDTERAKELWYDLSEGDGQDAYKSFRRNYERLVASGDPVW